MRNYEKAEAFVKLIDDYDSTPLMDLDRDDRESLLLAIAAILDDGNATLRIAE